MGADRYAVIDLDSLGYIVAYQQFVTLDNKIDKDKVKNHVRDFFSSILQAVEATHYCSFYQCKGHKNFRLGIYPEYKANRPPTPEYYTHWRSVITKVYQELKAIPLDIIESDDALSIVRDRYPNKNLIFCHNDKDMLQLYGEHYSFRKNEKTIITPKEAKLNLYTQILTGDSTDNIPGCKSIGSKKAQILLDNVTDLEEVTIEKFKSVGSDYIVMKQLITLLDDTQTYEELEIEFIKNTNLVDLNSLFEPISDVEDLFD